MIRWIRWSNIISGTWIKVCLFILVTKLGQRLWQLFGGDRRLPDGILFLCPLPKTIVFVGPVITRNEHNMQMARALYSGETTSMPGSTILRNGN